jgi:hypothetical protein
MSVLISIAAREVYTWVESLKNDGIDIAEHAGKKAVHEAQEFVDNPSLEEAADTIIAVLGACRGQEWTLRELGSAMLAKMEVNRQRTWERQPDGTYQHVKEASSGSGCDK